MASLLGMCVATAETGQRSLSNDVMEKTLGMGEIKSCRQKGPVYVIM